MYMFTYSGSLKNTLTNFTVIDIPLIFKANITIITHSTSIFLHKLYSITQNPAEHFILAFKQTSRGLLSWQNVHREACSQSNLM